MKKTVSQKIGGEKSGDSSPTLEEIMLDHDGLEIDLLSQLIAAGAVSKTRLYIRAIHDRTQGGIHALLNSKEKSAVDTLIRNVAYTVLKKLRRELKGARNVHSRITAHTVSVKLAEYTRAALLNELRKKKKSTNRKKKKLPKKTSSKQKA